MTLTARKKGLTADPPPATRDAAEPETRLRSNGLAGRNASGFGFLNFKCIKPFHWHLALAPLPPRNCVRRFFGPTQVPAELRAGSTLPFVANKHPWAPWKLEPVEGENYEKI